MELSLSEKQTSSPTNEEIVTKRKMSFFTKYETKSLILFFLIMVLFCYFMFLPILSVTVSAFNFSDPGNLFQHFIFIFENRYYRSGIINALFVGLTTTIICVLLGTTTAIIFGRYSFYGKKVFRNLSMLPLISPPFVGAFAITRLLERNGIISNFLKIFIPGLPDLLGNSLWGIVFIQSIHLWPLVYLNAAASYNKIDPTQEEQARNLGSKGLSLYRKIIVPLITPGIMAGAVLVFIFSIGDIGTPIILNPSDPYAPLIAFTEIRDRTRAIYLEASLALVIVLLVISLLALLFAAKFVGMKEYAGEKVSGMDLKRMQKQASKRKTALIWLIFITLLLISLMPHIGIILVAFVERIRVGEIIPTLWNFSSVSTVLSDPEVLTLILNTLLYSFLAMIMTIVIGVIIAFLVVRKKHLNGITFLMSIIGLIVGTIFGGQIANSIGNTSGKILVIIGGAILMAIIFTLIGKTLNVRCLELFATMPFAIPGIAIAVGYIQFFILTDSVWGLLPPSLDVVPILGIFTSAIRNFLTADFLNIPLFGLIENPLIVRFTNFWFILVISYAMRRMPYTVLAAIAILRQIHHSLEEAAHNLGASSRKTFQKITLPLMAGGIVAGGVLTFITSFTEVSTSLLILPKEAPLNPLMSISSKSDPLTRGIFDQIQRGDTLVGGVMGLVQLVVVTLGLFIAQKILGEKIGSAFGGGAGGPETK